MKENNTDLQDGKHCLQGDVNGSFPLDENNFQIINSPNGLVYGETIYFKLYDKNILMPCEVDIISLGNLHSVKMAIEQGMQSINSCYNKYYIKLK